MGGELCIGGENVDAEMMDPIEENNFYKPFGIMEVVSVTELLKDLDLSAWDIPETIAEIEVNNMGHRGDGILVSESVLDFESQCPQYCMLASDIGCYIQQGMNQEVVLIGGELVRANTWLGANIDYNFGGPYYLEDHGYIRNIGVEKVEEVRGEIPCQDGPVLTQKKRKHTSPIQSEMVMRLRREDGGGSPMLRDNSNKKTGKTKKLSPPKGGTTKSKAKRKISTPRRLFNDGMKQLLITSQFSPRSQSDGVSASDIGCDIAQL